MIRLINALKNQDKYSSYLNSILNNYGIDINYLEEYYKDIKTEKLYKSLFHGLYHSEKVCLYALILAKIKGLNEVETHIIRDAAIYHDIGRINDHEESTHGLIGANKIEEVIDVFNEVYKDNDNIVYLKAIIEAHSLGSKYKDIIFENYKYDYPNINYEKYERLYNILLDSDALDRTRFRITSQAALKEKYLRLDESKELIEFAKKLNEYYTYIESKEKYNKLFELYNPNDKTKQVQGCFHGISSNFFALDSILKYGILSELAMNELGISSPRNFFGNNNSLFISVIDDISYSKNGKANNKFLKNNISLYCLVTNLCSGTKKSEKFSDCLATHSDEYEDELFAFYKINKEQIYSIVLPKNMIYKDIKDLNYMEGSRNYDIIYQKINFYLKKLNSYIDINSYINSFSPLLDEYKKKVLDFEKKSEYEQRNTYKEFFNELDNILIELNKIIQEIVNLIWHLSLGKDKNETITVKEVINHILISNNIDFKIQDSGEELLFIINHQNVKKI